MSRSNWEERCRTSASNSGEGMTRYSFMASRSLQNDVTASWATSALARALLTE